MKKVLYITTHLNTTDGYGRYSHDVVLAAQKEGMEVLCVVEKDTKKIDVIQCKLLGPSYRYWLNIGTILKTARRVNVLLKEFQPDVIHILSEPYATMLPFLRTRGARTILAVYGTFAYIPLRVSGYIQKQFSTWLTHRYYRKVDRVIAVSTFTKARLLKHVPSVEKKTVVVHPAIVYYEKLLSDRPPSQKNNILFVGAIKERKGILQALAGVRVYRDTYDSEVRYTIVGHYDTNDRYYKKVCQYIEKHNLTRNVIWAGRVSEEELHKHYARTDVFLMTSIVVKGMFEGFGLVYLEANMHGVPTIGSVESGAIDAIVDGISGFLVDPYNPKAIAEKLYVVLHKGVIDRKECQRWAEENTVEKMTQKIFLLYE